MMDRIRGNILLTSPEPVPLKETEKIVEQMKNNSICRIDNHGIGIGFLVKIPYKSRLLSVLITTNSIINQDDIFNSKNKYIILFK